jgi:hypothetical protein
MQAACTTFEDPGELATVWQDIARQVLESELALATRLEFT